MEISPKQEKAASAKLIADFHSKKDVALSKFRNDPLKKVAAKILAMITDEEIVLQGLQLSYEEGYMHGARDLTKLTMAAIESKEKP